jgi:hypothetical protein
MTSRGPGYTRGDGDWVGGREGRGEQIESFGYWKIEIEGTRAVHLYMYSRIVYKVYRGRVFFYHILG